MLYPAELRAHFKHRFSLFNSSIPVLIIGFFDVIEVLAEYSFYFEGLGYVFEIFSRFEYPQFTFDQFLLGGHFTACLFGLIGVNPREDLATPIFNEVSTIVHPLANRQSVGHAHDFILNTS